MSILSYVPGSYYKTRAPENQQNGVVNSMYITDIRDPIEISNIKDMYMVMIIVVVILFLKFILKIVMSYKKSIVRQYSPPTVPVAISQANPIRNA